MDKTESITESITVVGMGYVGMSLAVLLAQYHAVTALEIDAEKIDKIKRKQSPIADADIDKFLQTKSLNLTIASTEKEAYEGAKFIVIATPTDYDSVKNAFNTDSVDQCVAAAREHNPEALIVIKSTIPIGHSEVLQEKYATDKIIFSPEFSREGRGLEDSLYPSRIIVGSDIPQAQEFGVILKTAAEPDDTPLIFMHAKEAETVKLFSNTYLAMRVAFFNELDNYALQWGLDSKSIIDSVCADTRIGEGYNNPSFGYGGYCLPKDTKQLHANFDKIPQNLIEAIIKSNSSRKDFIATQIIDKKPACVGIYRLVMKAGSDNFRSSAILGIIRRLRAANIQIIIHEPALEADEFEGVPVIADLTQFKTQADVIICNRRTPLLADVEDKIFTRDIFGEN